MSSSPSGPRKKLGEMLLEAGLIDQFRLQSALSHQQRFGGRLGRILVESSFITEDRLVRCLSRQLGVSSIDLDAQQIHARVVAEIPRETAERFGLCPVGVKRDAQGEVLYLAMSDPTNQDAIDAVVASTGKRVEPLVAGETAVRRAIERWYTEAAVGVAAADEQPLDVKGPEEPIVVEETPVVTGSIVGGTPAAGLPAPTDAEPFGAAGGYLGPPDDVAEAPARDRSPIEIDVGDPGEPIQLASAAEFVTSSLARDVELGVDMESSGEPMELASAAEFAAAASVHHASDRGHDAMDRGIELSAYDGSEAMQTEVVGGFVDDTPAPPAVLPAVLPAVTEDRCPGCANPRIAVAKFCPFCGMNLGATAPPGEAELALAADAVDLVDGAGASADVDVDVSHIDVAGASADVDLPPAVDVAPVDVAGAPMDDAPSLAAVDPALPVIDPTQPPVEPTSPEAPPLPVIDPPPRVDPPAPVAPPLPVVEPPAPLPEPPAPPVIDPPTASHAPSSSNGHGHAPPRALTLREIEALEAEPAPAGAVGALVDDVAMLATLQTRAGAPLFAERTPPPQLTGAARVDEPEVLRGEALVLAPHVVPGVREAASNELARADDVDVLVGGLRTAAPAAATTTRAAPPPPLAPAPFLAAPPPPPPPPPPPVVVDAWSAAVDVAPGAADAGPQPGAAAPVDGADAGAPIELGAPDDAGAPIELGAPDDAGAPIKLGGSDAAGAPIELGGAESVRVDLAPAAPPFDAAAPADLWGSAVDIDVDSGRHAAAPSSVEAAVVEHAARLHAVDEAAGPEEVVEVVELGAPAAPVDEAVELGAAVTADDPLDAIDVDMGTGPHAPAPVSAVSDSWADAFGPGAPEPAPLPAAVLDDVVVDVDVSSLDPPAPVLEDVEAVPLPTAEPPLASEWAALTEPAPIDVTKKSLAAEWSDIAETSIPRDVRDVRAAPVAEVPRAREVLVAATPTAPEPAAVVDVPAPLRAYVPDAAPRARTAAPWAAFAAPPVPRAAPRVEHQQTDLRALAERLTQKMPDEG